MTQCNILYLKLSNLQLNKLKSRIKNGTEGTLQISLNAVDDSNDQNNFPHKLLLTNLQVSKLCKAFANGLSANVKLSKTQLRKIGQSRGVLGRLLGIVVVLRLIENILKLLSKIVLIPLGLTAVASSIDAAIHKKFFGSDFPLDLASGNTTLIISMKKWMISWK